MTAIEQVAKHTVESFFNVKIEEKSRERDYVEGRCIYFKLVKDHSKLTISRIAKGLNKNHATVLHATSNAENWLQTERKFAAKFKQIEESFKKTLDIAPVQFDDVEKLEHFWNYDYQHRTNMWYLIEVKKMQKQINEINKKLDRLCKE